MNIVPVIKLVAGAATSLGAGAVVGNVITATTPVGMKLASKILVGVGGVTLAAVAGDAAGGYIERMIQSTVDGFKGGVKLGKDVSEGKTTFKDGYADTVTDIAEGQKDEPTES